MANSIASTKNYTALLDEVYRRAACSTCLNSPRRMARAGRNAREIMVPKIQVSGLGDYTRNVGYKTGSITYEFETKTFNYDRGIKLLADVMDVEEAGVLDCFVAAGSELQRTQVAPEADAFTFSEIAGHEGVTPQTEDFADAEAEDVLASLRAATNAMDEAEVTTGSRILFITPTLKGVLDDFSLANPARSNRVLERFSRIVEVPQTRFYSAIALNSGDGDQFGYSRAEGTYQLTEDTSVVSGKTYYTKSGEQYTPVSSPASGSLSSYYELVGAGAPINFMVVERSAVIKFDKHVASRVFFEGLLARRAGEPGQLHDEVPQVRHRGAAGQQAGRRARLLRAAGLVDGATGAAGCGPAPVSYEFYQDGYGGALAAEALAEALPAAVRCVGSLTGARDVRDEWDGDVADAWRRAVCAAADAYAEYGEGRVGGFSIGSFSVTNYRDEGTTGSEVAREAALAELSFTGLVFAGVR